MNTSSTKETVKEKSYSLESENGDSLEIRRIQRNLYEFCKFKIDEANQSFRSVAGGKLFNYCKSNSIVLSTDDQDYDRPIIKLLEQSNFQLKYTRVLYGKRLQGHQLLYEDIFGYKSVKEIGLDEFLKVFENVLEDSDKLLGHGVYFNALVELVEHEGGKYDPNQWKLVMLNGQAIGAILPQVYSGKDDWGGIMHIGLVAEARNKSYGRILHSKCLELLKDQRTKRYIGSTDINNKAMIRVFKISGCKEMFKRFIYEAN